MKRIGAFFTAVFMLVSWVAYGQTGGGIVITTPAAPVASTSVAGVVKCDGSTTVCAADGTITASAGGSAGITQLIGPVTTAAGTGAQATAITATGVTAASYGSSTSIPSFTVNAAGQLTAAAGNVVVAPAGTLSGTTLNATVVNSSLTSTGTLTGGATGAGFTVNLGTSTVSGNLPVANLNSGTGASGTTFWAGDGTWKTPTGSGSVSVTSLNPGLAVNPSPGTGTFTLDLQHIANTQSGTTYAPADCSALSGKTTLLTAGSAVAFTMPNVSQTGCGAHFGAVIQSATQAVTVSVTAPSTVNGLSSVVIPAGQGLALQDSDGLNYTAIGRTDLGSMATQAASAVAITGGTINGAAIGGSTPAAGAFTTVSATGKVSTVASATGGAGLNIPHGVAPTSPVNGDCWTTTAGLFCQINGSSIGPFGTGAGGGNVNAGGTLTSNAIVLGAGSQNVAVVGSLGTTTTVLHGNAGGPPTFGAVAISTDVSGLGTGVGTALGVNVGSAGAPVLFNGAGGTPSSLTLTNALGLTVAGGGTNGTTGRAALQNLSGVYVVCDSTHTNGGTSVTAVSSGTAETVLYACKIPANSLGATGSLRLNFRGDKSATANSDTWKWRFGAANSTAATQCGTISNASATNIYTSFRAANLTNIATNSQICDTGSVLGTVNSATTVFATPAIDTTADTYLVVTGTPGVTGDVLTADFATVELINVAGN